MDKCGNCSFEFRYEEKFCSNCGQKRNEEFSFKLLFNHTIANYFSLDSTLKKSFIPLIFQPGFLPKAFVSGQRTSYLHPAKFYFFISFLFFITLGLTLNNSLPSSEDGNVIHIQTNELNSHLSDSLIQNKIGESDDVYELKMDLHPKLIERLEDFNEISWNNFVREFRGKLPFTLFFSVPIFTLFLMWLLRKRKRNFAEHLTFSLYYFSFTFITLLLFLLSSNLSDSAFGSSVNFISFLIILVILLNWYYLTKGIQKFYEIKFKSSAIISTVQGVLFLFMLMPFSLILLAFYLLMMG
jgi:hypothetical protein